ncbi:hypothetical protein [Pseudobacteriovorax antillogorgiicola]|uniref:Lipoprotein n=1 Tax=Pseudobacteriovorax antillogorgiicola TaxID=1513793 RepID=A0A1Y6CQZ3_9BACT|nr:hypothetical protein [Pseudobacteriovorax antillogorgiicola]TCS42212.1 hypothetical protein EDD56_1439 [Pseudobacteriovorax antillogorgiicola]SMF82809.1 hypothetical protein SAMN06296036_14318 [Pseudobacteriovorax antillogorgiicola]
MIRSVFMTMFLILLTSCASHLPGTKGIDPKIDSESSDSTAPLEISLDRIDDLSSPQYQAYLVSLQNNRKDWTRVASIQLRFYAGGREPTFLLGEDLATYLKSVKRRNNITEHNKQLAIKGLAFISAPILFNHQSWARQAGTIGLASALSYDLAQRVIKEKGQAEFAKALPEGHVLKSFSIPPGLSNTAWGVIKMDENYDYRLIQVIVREKDGTTNEFFIPSSGLEKEAEKVYQARKKRKNRYASYQEILNEKIKQLTDKIKKS